MSLERRLQHAARELRAVDVAVPPLGATSRAGTSRRFSIQVVALPLLFVVGGLVVVGVLDDRRDAGGSFDDTPAGVDQPAAVAPAAPASPTPAVVASSASASLAIPSADAELVIIDRIVTAAARTDLAAPEAVADAAAPTIGFNGPL